MNKEELELITNELINYRQRKADLEIRKERVSLWQYKIDTADYDEINDLFDDTPECTLGMPKAKYKITSPTEQILFAKEIKVEQIQDWIYNEKAIISSIYYSLRKIEEGLNALTEEERFIVISKYIEKQNWLDIEESFNDRFRNKRNNRVTEKRLRNRCQDIKRKLYKLVMG